MSAASKQAAPLARARAGLPTAPETMHKAIMKSACLIVLLLSSVFAGPLFAQAPGAGARVAGSSTQPAAPPLDPELGNLLQRVEQLASALNVELGRLRVEKWKADSASKQQAEADIDSLQRNLTAALPGFVVAVRNAPRNVASSFRLYRNLNALHDVLKGVAEAAGAFGPRDQFERLAAQTNELDTLRMALGKRVEALAEAQAVELAQLRRAQRGALKKTVVDDNATPPKSRSPKRSKPPQQPSSQP